MFRVLLFSLLNKSVVGRAEEEENLPSDTPTGGTWSMIFLDSTWRFMGSYHHRYASTYNLPRGLRGLISRVISRAISLP